MKDNVINIVKGKLIVIEGLDGSGKATQTKILKETLESRGECVKQVSFPVYESESSSLIKMYLGGEIGSVNDVNPYAATTFYSSDRYISYVTDWKNDYITGSTIIADRYTTTNASYQMVKLPKNEWDAYLDWLYDYEFSKIKLPKPDVVIYLDVHPSISQKLMESRYNGDNSKKDIHESNYDYLMSCREGAMYSANKLGWNIIDCTDGKNILPLDDISGKILSVLYDIDEFECRG